MESMDRFCWSCGSGIYKNDRFCRKCGSDLVQHQPIDQGHETQPEDSYTPPTPIPEVAIKEVSTAPTSYSLLTHLKELYQKYYMGTPTPTSTATAPSPKPELNAKLVELEEANTPSDLSTRALQVGVALGWVMVVLAVLIILTNLVDNTDGVWQGNYWGVMNVVGSLLFGGVGFMIAKGCGIALQRRKHG